MPRFGEALLPQPENTNQASSDSAVEKHKARLARSRELVEAKRVERRKQEESLRAMEGANDNARELSVEEQIQQQQDKRESRAQVDYLLGMNKLQHDQMEPLYNQSNWYVNQEQQSFERIQAQLAEQKSKRTAYEAKGFFGRALMQLTSRLSGERIISPEDLARSEKTVGERQALLEGAKKELETLAKDRSIRLEERQKLSAQATQLDQEIAAFAGRFEEQHAQTIEPTPEERAREALFADMGEEELQQEQAARRSEKQVLQQSLREMERRQKQLAQEAAQTERVLVPSEEINEATLSLAQIAASHEEASRQLEQMRAQKDALKTSRWSAFKNKTKILALEQEVNHLEMILHGLDQHFADVQGQIYQLHHSPERQIAGQKKRESEAQASKLAKQMNLIQKRLLENDLQQTEIELRRNRLAHERPSPQVETPPAESSPSEEKPRNNVISLHDRLKARRRDRSASSFSDQRMAA